MFASLSQDFFSHFPQGISLEILNEFLQNFLWDFFRNFIEGILLGHFFGISQGFLKKLHEKILNGFSQYFFQELHQIFFSGISPQIFKYFFLDTRLAISPRNTRDYLRKSLRDYALNELTDSLLESHFTIFFLEIASESSRVFNRDLCSKYTLTEIQKLPHSFLEILSHGFFKK